MARDDGSALQEEVDGAATIERMMSLPDDAGVQEEGARTLGRLARSSSTTLAPAPGSPRRHMLMVDEGTRAVDCSRCRSSVRALGRH